MTEDMTEDDSLNAVILLGIDPQQILHAIEANRAQAVNATKEQDMPFFGRDKSEDEPDPGLDPGLDAVDDSDARSEWTGDERRFATDGWETGGWELDALIEEVEEALFEDDEDDEGEREEGEDAATLPAPVASPVPAPAPAPVDVATPQAQEQAVDLYGKFIVERVDGKDRPGGPKANALYFVLDYINDPVARVALRAYEIELRRSKIDLDLADDLNREINETRKL